MPQFSSLGDRLSYTFTNALNSFMSFLPSLLGAIVVLVLGWIVSAFLARLLERGLRLVGLERAVAHSGLADFMVRTGSTWTASTVISELAKWLIRLIFIQAAANVLGMPQVTAIINSIVLFIPNIIIALLILVLGSMLARFLARAVRGSVSEIGLENPDVFAKITQYLVVGLSILAALNELRIAPIIVSTLFIGFVAAIALAIGISFGLGGREVAADLTQGWYRKARSSQLLERERGREGALPKGLTTGLPGSAAQPEEHPKTGS